MAGDVKKTAREPSSERITPKREAAHADRQPAQGALTESDLSARAVLDAAIDPIITIDARGRIQSFNPAAEIVFGYTAQEVIGSNVNLLMPSPDREDHDRYIRRYLETGKRAIIGIGREVVGRRKDGTAVPLRLGVTDTVLRGHHLFIGVLRDLTAEKKAELRERELRHLAQQNERMADIGAVTARIAHDFGNPLASLTMTGQRILHRIARDPVAPVESLKSAAETIVDTARRLDLLVREFKDFARETRLDLQRVDVQSLLSDVAESWEGEAASHEIRLECAIPAALPSVRADHDKLRRVLDNLVKNALEAIDRGPGMVRMAAELAAPDKLALTVEDSGSGIPQGLDVFALFETTKKTGTGLGLPICRQIILAHGGGIGFAPRAPQGTVFCVELPISGPV